MSDPMSAHEPVFRDQQVTVHDVAHDVLVRCPRCDRCARVFSPAEEAVARRPWRLVCRHCGYNAERSSRCCRVLDSGMTDPVRDPIFRVPVWLQAGCCGGKLLWAYNVAHLSYVASFVAATIRERSDAVRAGDAYPRRMSMIAKLPAWLKAAKHRDEILRTVDRLRKTVDGCA